jgi:hypothetical protein
MSVSGIPAPGGGCRKNRGYVRLDERKSWQHIRGKSLCLGKSTSEAMTYVRPAPRSRNRPPVDDPKHGPEHQCTSSSVSESPTTAYRVVISERSVSEAVARDASQTPSLAVRYAEEGGGGEGGGKSILRVTERALSESRKEHTLSESRKEHSPSHGKSTLRVTERALSESPTTAFGYD